LVDLVGGHINNPVYINLLMPTLIAKWNELPVKNLSYLLVCLSQVAKAIKLAFLPYWEPVFRRCVSLVKMAISQQNVSRSSQSFEEF